MCEIPWDDVYAYYCQGELGKWVKAHGLNATLDHFRKTVESFRKLRWTQQRVTVDALRLLYTAPDVHWIQTVAGRMGDPLTVGEVADAYLRNCSRQSEVAEKVHSLHQVLDAGVLWDVRLIVIDDHQADAAPYIYDGNTRALAVATNAKWAGRKVTVYRGASPRRPHRN